MAESMIIIIISLSYRCPLHMCYTTSLLALLHFTSPQQCRQIKICEFATSLHLGPLPQHFLVPTVLDIFAARVDAANTYEQSMVPRSLNHMSLCHPRLLTNHITNRFRRVQYHPTVCHLLHHVKGLMPTMILASIIPFLTRTTRRLGPMLKN
jgi:hypothetical protein